jgi:RecQ-mediated genome instability protein 1
MQIMLRHVVVARGFVLLEPTTATVLGGRIESLHKEWVQNRKSILKNAMEVPETLSS